MTGPVYLLWGDENDHPASGTDAQRPQAEDRTTPRFHETDDPDVNRLYGRDHIMVRKDGSEMRPHEWEKEDAPEQEPDNEPSLRDDNGPDDPKTPGSDGPDDLDPPDPDDELDR